MAIKTGDKILGMMKDLCSKKDDREYLSTLERIYGHLSKHPNEAPDSKVESIKNIIDSEFEEE